jgi:Mrp family chromosome partitioning ATPase
MSPDDDGGSIPVRSPGSGSSPSGPSGGGGGGGDSRKQQMQKKMKLRMQIQQKLEAIDHKVVVMSGKGGVGKTTVAVNLAAALADAGLEVGLLDLDLTNPNAPAMVDTESAEPVGGTEEEIQPLRLEEGLQLISTEFFMHEGEDTVIWRGPIKMNVIRELLGKVDWGELDYLVVDLPPGTSDEPLTIAQMIKDAEGLVLVTTPQDVSVMDVHKSMNFADAVDLPVLGVVENMAGFTCPDCGSTHDVFGAGGGERVAEEGDVDLLGSVPLDPAIVEQADEGSPYVTSAPDEPAGAALQEVTDAVRDRVEGGEEGD